MGVTSKRDSERLLTVHRLHAYDVEAQHRQAPDRILLRAAAVDLFDSLRMAILRGH